MADKVGVVGSPRRGSSGLPARSTLDDNELVQTMLRRLRSTKYRANEMMRKGST